MSLEKRQALAAVLFALACACGDPIHPAQRLEKLRPLAARLEAADDPQLATPRPGGRARVSWLVAGLTPAQPFGLGLALCPQGTAPGGITRCAGPRLQETRLAGLAPASPSWDFDVPDGEPLWLHGVLCARGTPRLGNWPDGFDCGESDGIRVGLSIEPSSEDRNLNPTLADATLSFDGQLWKAPVEPLPQSCPTTSLPELPLVRAVGAEHGLRLELPGNDREAGRETLTLAAFSDAGELEQLFATIEAPATRTASSLRLSWQAPTSAASEGRLTRFFFVLRDGRGGSDWTTRALCLTP